MSRTIEGSQYRVFLIMLGIVLLIIILFAIGLTTIRSTVYTSQIPLTQDIHNKEVIVSELNNSAAVQAATLLPGEVMLPYIVGGDAILISHSLTMNVVGSGSIAAEPDKSSYNDGEQVTLTAAADPGWSFSGWSGDLSGSANPANLVMDADKIVMAAFSSQGGGERGRVQIVNNNVVANKHQKVKM